MLVDTPPGSAAVARIWQQLGQGMAPETLLFSLLADGIAGTPGFALLTAVDGQRLFCRGLVGATIVARAGTGEPAGAGWAERIDGVGLLTWREHLVPDSAERIVLGEQPDEELRLPAASGVLLSGSVIVDLTNFAAKDTVPYGDSAPAGGPGQDLPDAEPAGAAGDAEPGSAGPEGGGHPGAVRPAGQRTIVFYPDTITIPHPGSLSDYSPDAPGGPVQAWPNGHPAAARFPLPLPPSAAEAAGQARPGAPQPTGARPAPGAAAPAGVPETEHPPAPVTAGPPGRHAAPASPQRFSESARRPWRVGGPPRRPRREPQRSGGQRRRPGGRLRQPGRQPGRPARRTWRPGRE